MGNRAPIGGGEMRDALMRQEPPLDVRQHDAPGTNGINHVIATTLPKKRSHPRDLKRKVEDDRKNREGD
jgi:uncharacterized membrane protein YeiH